MGSLRTLRREAILENSPNTFNIPRDGSIIFVYKNDRAEAHIIRHSDKPYTIQELCDSIINESSNIAAYENNGKIVITLK
jgi:hypothetical protein